MRPRRGQGSVSTAEELVAVADRLRPCLGASHEAMLAYSERLRAETGYDAVQDIRARRWLRRGKPADYDWRAR